MPKYFVGTCDLPVHEFEAETQQEAIVMFVESEQWDEAPWDWDGNPIFVVPVSRVTEKMFVAQEGWRIE